MTIASVLFSFMTLLGISTTTPPELMPVVYAETPDTDERYATHENYAACTPTKTFSKLFPKFSLKKVMKKSSKRNLRTPNNKKILGDILSPGQILGADVSTNQVYLKKFFGIKVPGRAVGYARITQKFDSEKRYLIGVSDTLASAFRVRRNWIDLNLIFVPVGSELKTYSSPQKGEYSGCTKGVDNAPDTCHSTAWAEFEVDAATFDYLSNVDSSRPFPIMGAVTKDEFAECPLFFSPYSFQAAKTLIDGQYEKSLTDRQKQIDRNGQ